MEAWQSVLSSVPSLLLGLVFPALLYILLMNQTHSLFQLYLPVGLISSHFSSSADGSLLRSDHIAETGATASFFAVLFFQDLIPIQGCLYLLWASFTF